jgi:hypothetical protein
MGGTATPAEARKLIVEFVNQGADGRIDPRLIAHVGMCFWAWLACWSPQRWQQPSQTVSSLDVAFGIAAPPRRGHPGIKPEVRRALALSILERRLAGATLEQAVGAIADERQELKKKFHRAVPVASETEISRAWADCKFDALEQFMCSRSAKFDPEKIKRLKQIFKNSELVEYLLERHSAPEKSSD